MDVSRHILIVDTSVLVKSNMDRREYQNWSGWKLATTVYFGAKFLLG
jgi:hypothetical protein